MAKSGFLRLRNRLMRLGRPLPLLCICATAGLNCAAAVFADDPGPADIVAVPFVPERDGPAAADCLAYVELFSESVLEGVVTREQDPMVFDTFDEADRAGKLLEKAMEVIAARKGSEGTRDLARATAERYRQRLTTIKESGDAAEAAALAIELTVHTHECAAKADAWSAAEGWGKDAIDPDDDRAPGRDLP